jgi:antirestriction protein ArdC
MKMEQIRAEALDRAANGNSLTNYPAIYRGLMAMGIAEADIDPRRNVFTYRAWQALGRQVRKGQHGVKISTYAPIGEKRDERTGEIVRPAGRRPWSTTVFHVSQTDAIGDEPTSLRFTRVELDRRERDEEISGAIDESSGAVYSDADPGL